MICLSAGSSYVAWAVVERQEFYQLLLPLSRTSTNCSYEEPRSYAANFARAHLKHIQPMNHASCLVSCVLSLETATFAGGLYTLFEACFKHYIPNHPSGTS